MTVVVTNTRIPGAKLQLSNGYSADFDKLARLLHAVCHDSRARIPQADIARTVGFADRQVKALCGIARALGLMRQITYTPTPLGRLVQARDPFFGDLGTLWFLHYVISSDMRNLVWNRLVTRIIPLQRQIVREQLRWEFEDLANWVTEHSIREHLPAELSTVLDAYTTQLFSRLAYLRANTDGYVLGYREPVPPLVLAASIACFRDRHRSGETAISVEDLLTARNSPGVVFQIDETRMRASLEQLKMQPSFSLESRADLDQVRLTDNTPEHLWMERYYAGR